jgi:hypothetical protein
MKLQSGIYFLISSDVVVYVGKTKRWPWRLKEHSLAGDYKFDRSKFLEYPDDELLKWESAYIRKYNPKYNTYCKRKQRKMKFRKLTEKSFVGFGNHKDRTVGTLISLGKSKEIISMYFKLSHITFFDDVLEKIGITEEWRIEKPGTNYEKFRFFIESHPKVFPPDAHEKRLFIDAKITRKHISQITNSKSELMRRNRKYT